MNQIIIMLSFSKKRSGDREKLIKKQVGFQGGPRKKRQSGKEKNLFGN